MIFINISSDQIAIHGKGIHILVPYEDLERALPDVLSDLYKKHPFDKVRVLNGPGGFTLLRIGCLVVNTLQMTLHNKLTIYSCTKLDLFNALVEKGFLPHECLIFIGQKKNIWTGKYNPATEQIATKLVQIESLRKGELGNDYFIDQIYDHPIKDDLNSDKMISLEFDGEQLHIRWMGKKSSFTAEDLQLPPLNYIQPNYMIAPEIN